VVFSCHEHWVVRTRYFCDLTQNGSLRNDSKDLLSITKQYRQRAIRSPHALSVSNAYVAHNMPCFPRYSSTSDFAKKFIPLLVIFVTALLLGFLSHAPGSLGVIDAAMLIALPQFQKEELLESLPIFRFVYFILPLCGAVLARALRELWFNLAARRLRDPKRQ
jgi:hypothetical protein